jgi:prepilin-type processing-associated H-X9-DG protein
MRRHATSRSGTLPSHERGRPAFSLVELLASLGLIAFLTALLLPALGRAREHANQVKCLSNLRTIGLAAQLHATEHQGYLPTAGWQWQCVGGVCDPRGLEDERERRYEYYDDVGVKRPVPITVALGRQLGVECRTDGRQQLAEDMARESLRRHFRCPSQQTVNLGWTQRGDEGGSWIAPEEYSSYAFNEALLGRSRSRLAQCPRGKLSRVVEPSRVFFALDGRIRDQHTNRYHLVPDPEDLHGGNATLFEFHQFAMTAEPNIGRELLDFSRHRMRINAVFCDGHADSFPMGLPPDGGESLKQIYVSRGISVR